MKEISVEPVPHGSHRRSAEAGLCFAMGFLPYCNIFRLPPDPLFWGTLAAMLLFALWLVLQRGMVRSGSVAVPVAALILPIASLLVMLQLLLGMPGLLSSAVLDAVTLLFAFAVSIAARSRADAGSARTILVAFAWGLVAALAMNAIAVLLGLAGYELIGFVLWRVPTLPRAVGLLGQPNQLAIVAVAAVGAGFMLRRQRALPSVAWWMLLAIGAFVCAASGSRIGTVGWLLLMMLIAWADRRRKEESRSGALSAGIRDAIIGAVVLVLMQAAWIGLRGSADGVETMARSNVSARLELAQDALALLRLHPLLGVGQGNFAAARLHELDTPLSEPNAAHAHNVLLQALAVWGVPGGVLVVAFAVLVMTYLWRSVRHSNGDSSVIFVVGWLVVMLAYSLVEYPFSLPPFLLPSALMLGLLPQPAASLGQRRAHPRRQVTIGLALLVLAAAAAAGWDYHRTQDLAVKLMADSRSNPEGTVQVPLAASMRIRDSTIFPVFPEIMVARALPFNETLAAEKLEIAARAMNALPTSEAIARYAAFSVLAGRTEQAEKIISSVRIRNDELHQRVLDMLRDFAAVNPRVLTLIEADGMDGR